MSALLEAVNIGKRFGGIEALSSISLTIQRGEIYGLIGPNGAGKTTFFNVLTGVYRADSGDFNFNDTVLNISAPHEVAASGIARTFQNIRLFANMSALENVMVGRHVRTRPASSARFCVMRAPAPKSAPYMSAPARCSNMSACPDAATNSRAACLTAISAALKSPAHWPPIRICSPSMSRPPA
jgi:ABC-type branched-subunit amino acid transport system ATPase component